MMPKGSDYSAHYKELQKQVAELNQKLVNQHDSYNTTIRKLSDKCCMRGARMQLLREFMQSRRCNSNADYWEQYCRINPEAEGWFDNYGVPS